MLRFGFVAADAALPTHVKRLEVPSDILSSELTLAARLRPGDHVLCVTGDIVPCDGQVIAGSASIDEPDGTSRMLGASLRGQPITRGSMVRTNYLIIRVGMA